MDVQHTLADRLRARARQLGLTGADVATRAGVNRSFVYDILKGRSTRPGLERLGMVASVLKVDPDWLLSGMGALDGVSPFIESPDEAFVQIAWVGARPSMGGGAVVEPEHGERHDRPYRFRRDWIRQELKTSPSNLRILQVAGDSMAPTLLDGDTVLVDLMRKAPNPPGLFVLDDGLGLVAKRLDPVPAADPPAVRIISDNPLYSPYERSSEEITIIGRICWFAREV